MSNIPNLASLARLRLGSGGGSTVRRKAFGFDGVNDYISSNATIGRTGYDMNVSGNVTTGSDGDGDYIFCNGNRLAGTGANAFCGASSTPSYNQTNSFTIKARVKINSLPPSGSTGIFGSNGDCGINTDSAGNDLFFGLNGSTSVLYTASAIFTLGVYFDAYLVYDASVSKFYCYFSSNGVSSSLLNAGGTSGPATFATDSWRVGDGGMTATTDTSGPKFIYHACIRNKALTQAEIDADIALGNTTKQDPSIVAYYVPENLQYNTQYLTSPKTFGGTGRSVRSNATITTNTSTAPDGATTASTYVINAAGTQITNAVEQSITSISGATIASKTFIVKAFVRVTSGINTFRLKCSHAGVADYYSSNQSATTTRQEFTFTQAFTSSTSGTGINAGLTSDTGNTAGSFEVRNVRLYLVNQTLRDESPNIGGFIGRKTQQVLSCRTKPNIDAVDSALSQILISNPYFYTHIRRTDNQVVFRFDGSRVPAGSISATSSALGNGFRNKVHILGVVSYTGDTLVNKIYINGVFAGSGTSVKNIPTAFKNANMKVGNFSSGYYNGNIRDPRIYTFTGSFTDADALAIYNGGEPTSAGVTKYLHYRPPVGEVGTTTQDLSPNDRDGTLNGGVTRIYL